MAPERKLLKSRKRQNLDKASAVDTGGAGGARANPEFGVSEKGQSLLSAYRSLGLGVTPGFKKQSTVLNAVLPDLPQEVWCIIFAYLPTKSRKNATSTCKFWFEIIRGDSRFSGNITIPWIEVQNFRFDWDNWPSLKTLAITDSSFSSPKLALNFIKDKDFKKCPSLEKVTLGVDFELAELSQEILKNIGTVLALTFNPKLDIDLFKLVHVDKLEIPWIKLQNSSFDWDNWPSLKTIDITGDSSFPSPKIALEALKALGLKKCKSLKTITFLMDYVSLYLYRRNGISNRPPFVERHSFDDRIQVLFEMLQKNAFGQNFF